MYGSHIWKPEGSFSDISLWNRASRLLKQDDPAFTPIGTGEQSDMAGTRMPEMNWHVSKVAFEALQEAKRSVNNFQVLEFEISRDRDITRAFQGAESTLRHFQALGWVPRLLVDRSERFVLADAQDLGFSTFLTLAGTHLKALTVGKLEFCPSTWYRFHGSLPHELRSLSISYVAFDVSDLARFVTACPTLERIFLGECPTTADGGFWKPLFGAIWRRDEPLILEIEDGRCEAAGDLTARLTHL